MERPESSTQVPGGSTSNLSSDSTSNSSNAADGDPGSGTSSKPQDLCKLDAHNSHLTFASGSSNISPYQRQSQAFDQINNSSYLVPGGTPVYTGAFLGILEDRFFLQDPPGSAASSNAAHHGPWNIFSSWIVAARSLGERDKLLKDTLLAISFRQVGSEMQDPRIVNTGFATY
jgi:hypothetical protein